MNRVHPTDALLAAFAQGRLSPAEVEQLSSHVLNCQRCGQRLAGVGDDRFVQVLRATAVRSGDTKPSAAAATISGLPAELRDHPRYQILRRVGAGGMGEVYEAVHRMMKRHVAVKIIRGDLVSTPISISRFRREVQAAGQLTHPNIVTAYDAEEVSGLHFLVMEFVEGKSLDRLVEEKGPLPVAQACGIIRQVALGLQHAHDRGMVHRDIKPHNLMLSKSGKVKILDFGLARWQSQHAGNAVAHLNAGVTGTGAALGTPFFLAPEQARSPASVDHRADLYGLGATLYYLLTSQPPIPPLGSLEEAPALPEHVPDNIRGLVARLLDHSPDARFQSARQVADALGDASPSKLSRVSTAKSLAFFTRARFKTRLAVALSLIVVLALFLAWWTLTTGRQDRPDQQSRRDTGEVRQPTRSVVQTIDAPSTQPRTVPPGEDPPGKTAQPHQASSVRIVFLLPTTGLWYEDYAPARSVFEKSGCRVYVATPGGKPSALHPDSMRNEPNRPDAVPANVDLMSLEPEPYTGFVCVGYLHGELTDSRVPSGKKVNQLLNEAVLGQKWIVGICVGQKVLGAAGVLRGKKIAASSQYVGDLRPLGASPQSNQVVLDGHILTATGPQNSAEAASLLLERLLRK